MADYDVPAAVEEAAKAVQSVSETSRGLGNYLAAVMGEAPYTVGQIVNDRLQAFRFKKMVDYTIAAKKRLEAAGLRAEELQLPPPTIEVPLLAAASLEDRDELRELWEKLLAAAIAPATRNRVRARHIEILQKLEPLDACLLRDHSDITAAISQEKQNESPANPSSKTSDDFARHASARLKCSFDEISVSLSSLRDLHLIGINNHGYPNMTATGRNLLDVVSTY